MRSGRTLVGYFAALITAAGVVAACGDASGNGSGGSAPPPSASGPESVGGLPITTEDQVKTGFKPGAPDHGLQAENATGDEMDTLALGTLADLYEYWAQAMPANFDKQFAPLKRLVSYDAEGEPQRLCGTSTKDLVNAFFCPSEDTVAWDRGVLLPTLDESFGPVSVVIVLAHEVGHAVQYRLGARGLPGVVLEQQADCYAGGFMRWIGDGRSKRFQVSTTEGINNALATLFFIRDPAGSDPSSPSAHGLAFDRVYAFQAGFTRGPKACAEMTTQEVSSRISQEEFAEKDRNRGDVPVNAEYVEKLGKSLATAFEGTGARAPEIRDNGAKCARGKATSPASYCPDDNTVAIDLTKLTKIGKPLKRGSKVEADATSIGDFAAFAEIASRYTLSVQKAAGLPIEGPQAALRTACLTGGWARASKDGKAGSLRLSSGDLDEAVAEMLRERSLVAADVTGKAATAGFTRVEAFRIGFMQSADCMAKYPA